MRSGRPSTRAGCDDPVARQATDSSLSRHVPPIALRWVQDSPEKTWHTIDGSLCFADISGFTALTERLTAHGRLGAEELVETLSGVFGTMLDVAAERGGQLLKFGGDALLLLFDGDAHARRAAGAAVEMRRALRSATGTSAVGRLKLSMSVGIGSGEILFLLVGAPHRELVIVGPVVEQTLTAEQVASAGQILVTGATAAAPAARSGSAARRGPPVAGLASGAAGHRIRAARRDRVGRRPCCAAARRAQGRARGPARARAPDRHDGVCRADRTRPDAAEGTSSSRRGSWTRRCRRSNGPWTTSR